MNNGNKVCNIDRTNDLVRKEYKRYKKRRPPPDFREVIDFLEPCKYEHLIKRIDVDVSDKHDGRYCCVGLKHPKDWFVYELKTSPGFIVIRNPFLSYGAQSHWVKQSLTEYTKKPFPCNLDVLMDLDKEKTLWEISHEYSSFLLIYSFYSVIFFILYCIYIICYVKEDFHCNLPIEYL